MVRPPSTVLMRPRCFMRYRIALFFVTLSASSPVRLRSVVVTISERFGEAIDQGSFYTLPAASSQAADRASRVEANLAAWGAPWPPGAPVTETPAFLACCALALRSG